MRRGGAALWLGALGLDLAFGEPPRPLHPVVLMGRAIGALERHAPSSDTAARRYGVVIACVPAACAALAGLGATRIPHPPARTVVALWLLKSAFSLRELVLAGTRVERALGEGALDRARVHARDLVSRPTGDLADDELASAAIESLAENLADSYVAPLLFYRLGGLPAALAYRAINTADAMVGYRGRYEHLGKAAARLDDVASFVPSRVSALALLAATPLVRADTGRALRVALRDHALTESPNAGWPMSAAAGALGIRLAKRGHYALGDAVRPAAADISRARRLVVLSAILATVVVLATSSRWQR